MRYIPSEGSPIAIHVRWTRVLPYLLGSLAFVAVGIAMVVIPSRPNLTLVGWVVIIVFAGVGVFWGVQLFRRTPLVRMDFEGIEYRAPAMPAPRSIAWREIGGMAVTGARGGPVLGINPVDPEGYLDDRSPRERARLVANRRLTGYLVLVPLHALELPPREILRHAERMWRDVARGYT